MQLLRESTVRDDASAAACARAVLDGVPVVMQFIRHVAGKRKAPGLTVQQFRALGVLRSRPDGASLSDVAEYLGLSLPTASRMIDGLVLRGLVHRRPQPENRRQVRLKLQPAGARLLEAAVDAALRAMELRLRSLPPTRRRAICRAVGDLRTTFAPASSRSTDAAAPRSRR